MLAIRSLLRPGPQLLKNVAQQRNMSGIAIPSRNKVSKGEVFVLSAMMVVGWCSIPAWVLVNMKHYRDKE